MNLKKCSKCQQEKPVDCFGKHKHKIDGLNSICKTCLMHAARLYRKTNPESNRRAVRRYKEKNPDKKVSKRFPPEYHRQWRLNNKDKVLKSKQKYLLKNPHMIDQWDKKRKEAIRKATPKWLTLEQKQEIADIYRQRRTMSEWHEITYHVDHIEPIRGKRSCGLHVPWNLQIITAEENMRKLNKL